MSGARAVMDVVLEDISGGTSGSRTSAANSDENVQGDSETKNCGEEITESRALGLDQGAEVRYSITLDAGGGRAGTRTQQEV